MAFPIAGRHNKFPIGIDGDRTVSTANEYIDWSASSTALDYRNLTVNSGCTLWVRVLDGTPAVLGVAGNLTVNGSIQVIDRYAVSQWPLNTTKNFVLRSFLPVYSWLTPGVKTGGAGGRGGSRSGVYASGGAQSGGGVGGGGGGGTAGIDGGSMVRGGDGGSAANGGNGAGGPPSSWLSTWISSGGTTSGPLSAGGNFIYDPDYGFYCSGGNGGSRASTDIFGTAIYGSGGGGGGCASSFVPISSYSTWGCGGGGSGGPMGHNGGHLTIIVRGLIAGSGSLIANGSNGGNGYPGGNGGTSVIGGSGLVRTGAGGGGGGGGGHGGTIILYHNSVSIPLALTAYGGNYGSGGTLGGGYNTDAGVAGSAGSAGSGGVAATFHW